MLGIGMLYIGWTDVKEHVNTQNCQLYVVIIYSENISMENRQSLYAHDLLRNLLF